MARVGACRRDRRLSILKWEMQMTVSILRRAAIVCAAAVLFGALLKPASAADSVSFRLDWTLSGYQLPFYWAKEKGYYTAENLDVDIKEGAGSGKTVALMAGQQDDV